MKETTEVKNNSNAFGADVFAASPKPAYQSQSSLGFAPSDSNWAAFGDQTTTSPQASGPNASFYHPFKSRVSLRRSVDVISSQVLGAAWPSGYSLRLDLVLYRRDRIARVRILSIPLNFDEDRAFGGDENS